MRRSPDAAERAVVLGARAEGPGAVHGAHADRRSGPVTPAARALVRALPSVRLAVGGAVLVGLASTAAIVVQAVALGRLLASAIPGAGGTNRLAALISFAAAAAVRGGLALVGEIIARVGAARAQGELRRALVRATLDPRSGAPVSAGEVATIAGRGIDALDVYFGRCLPDLVLAAAAPLALAAAIGALDWLSGVIVLVAIALFPLFGALVGRASVELAADRWRQLEALGRQIVDVFEGLPVLRALGLSAAQRSRIEDTSNALASSSLSVLRGAFLSALVLDTIASVSVALVAVPLGLRLLDGSVRLGAALAVLIVAPEAFIPLRRASADFHESTEGLAAAARAMAVIGSGVSRKATQRAGDSTAPAGNATVPDPLVVPVALEAVRIRVPGREAPVLDQVSLVIEPGKTVVLLGENGAGKSTIGSLLLGVSRPSEGRVLVGSTELTELDLASWRRRITYLPEHPTLLAASLADNLRLANAAATDDELVVALVALGLTRFLDGLEDGLETVLGDGGRPVSAGELQRIALARVLVRRTSLYVLDEPTVHLDGASEVFALDALGRVLEDKSALVITHRLAVCALADRVVSLRDGKIIPAAAWPIAPGVEDRALVGAPVAAEPRA